MQHDARSIAHDLNNSIFVVSGYAQRLEEAMALGHPRQADVQAILAEVPRLCALVDRIRALGAPAAAHQGSPGTAAPAPRQRRILLVEDERSVRDLLRYALERRGYHVDTGETGDEGLALCDTLAPPDLLITDLILPGAPGPAIVARLRSRVPGAKVLVMSGYAEHPLLEAVHAAGEPCLVKPFEMATFTATVERLLAA